ncbi:MAG: DUF1801 domain-containing protein [Pseudomonadota bacterium]
MMHRDVASVADYLADLPDWQREKIEIIRKTIFAIKKDQPEGLDYGMLDYPGLANLAGQRAHVSFYVKPEVLARHKSHFPKTSAGKSCLRFSKTSPVPEDALKSLIEDVYEARAKSPDASGCS